MSAIKAAWTPTLILALHCAGVANGRKFLEEAVVTELVAELLDSADDAGVLPAASVYSAHGAALATPATHAVAMPSQRVANSSVSPLSRVSVAPLLQSSDTRPRPTFRPPSFLRSAMGASSSYVISGNSTGVPAAGEYSQSFPDNASALDLKLVDTSHKRGRRALGKFQEWQSWSELVYLQNKGFLFCALPKSGCTSWKLLLLRASGSPHGNASDSSLIHDPARSGLRLLGVKQGMNTRDPKARNMSDIASHIAEPNLFSAAIVRDPVTRVLSTYLDRCVDNNEWARCFSKGPVSFKEAIAGLELSFQSASRSGVKDVHFRRQIDMCGFRHMNYSFVGHFENFSDDSKYILQRAGLWEDFGRSGWGHHRVLPFGAEAQAASNHMAAKHETTRLVCEHYTPELLERVHGLYRLDFEAFNYSTDVWTSTCGAAWRKKKQPSKKRRHHLRSSLA